MVIIKQKRKLEDYQLRELEVEGLLINPANLDLKYLYEKPSADYISLRKWESNNTFILKDGWNFYLVEIEI